MGKYILKRCVYIVLVFLILSFLMYALYNLIPSDPARQELEPQRKGLKAEEYQMLYQQLRKEMERTSQKSNMPPYGLAAGKS